MSAVAPPVNKRRRIGLSLIIAMIADLLNKIAPLIILNVAKANLGLQSFGEAQHAITNMESLIPFIAFGYTSVATLEIGKNLKEPKVIGEISSDVLALKGLHLLFVLAIASIMAHSSADAPAVFIASTLLLVASALDTDFLHFATQKMAARNMLMIAAKLLSLLGVVLLVKDPGDTAYYTALTALPAFALSVFSCGYNLQRIKLERINIERMKRLIVASIPFGVFGFIFTFLDRFDALLVNHLYNDAMSGLYIGQMRLVQAVSTAASSIGLIFYSEMVAEHDPEAFSNLAAKSLWAMTAIVAPIACGVWFVGQDVLRLQYGPEFVPHAMVLNILTASSLLFVFIQVFGNQILFIRRRVNSYNIYMTLGIALGSAVAYALAPLFGIEGIALGNLTAKAFCVVSLIILSQPYLRNFPWLELIGIAAPCAAMVGTLLALPKMSLWFTVPAGGAAYALTFLLCNRRKIRTILRKGSA